MDEILQKLILDVSSIKEEIGEIKQLVRELHAIQTGKLYNPSNDKPKPKRLTKKEKKIQEMQELQQLRKDLHMKWLNRDYRPKK